MDVPLGHAVGNAVEVAECVDLLHGRGPADLAELIVHEATRMVRLAGKAATDTDARSMVHAALASGAAAKKLQQLIAWQGGDPAVVDDVSRLPSARHTHAVTAARAGVVTAMDALLVGRTALALGAGRHKKSDAVDHAAGVILHKKPGDTVTAGETVMELRYNDEARLHAAVAHAGQAVVIGDQPPAPPPLVMGWVHEHGETMFVGGM
jgi:thymidine phosphorylase